MMMKSRLAVTLGIVAAIALSVPGAEFGRSMLRRYKGVVQAAQDGTIAPAENLVVAGVPAIPGPLGETAGRDGADRSATLADCNPTRREELIATPCADTAQPPFVNVPGGERQ